MMIAVSGYHFKSDLVLIQEAGLQIRVRNWKLVLLFFIQTYVVSRQFFWAHKKHI